MYIAGLTDSLSFCVFCARPNIRTTSLFYAKQAVLGLLPATLQGQVTYNTYFIIYGDHFTVHFELFLR